MNPDVRFLPWDFGCCRCTLTAFSWMVPSRFPSLIHSQTVTNDGSGGCSKTIVHANFYFAFQRASQRVGLFQTTTHTFIFYIYLVYSET